MLKPPVLTRKFTPLAVMGKAQIWIGRGRRRIGYQAANPREMEKQNLKAECFQMKN
jgi:hypothetical protein